MVTRAPITVEPPFTRKSLGKIHFPWLGEIELAHAFAAERGLKFELVFADYQIARLTDDEIRLLIYPHTTRSTFNKSARVRDEGSKNKQRAQVLMALLDRSAGFNNTFSTHWTKNPLAHRLGMDLLDPKKVPAIEAASLHSASTPNPEHGA